MIQQKKLTTGLFRNRKHLSTSSGFSIIESLLSLALLMIVLLAISQIWASTSLQIQRANIKLNAVQLQSLLFSVLGDPKTCSCHLNADWNTTKAGQLKIDTTVAQPTDIDLGWFRSGCDFSSPENIIAQAGEMIGSGGAALSVKKVSLSRIRPTGTANEYSGAIRIDLATRDDAPLKPVIARVRVLIDTSTGTASARNVASCFGPTDVKGITECPPGFVMGGTPGTSYAYCIEPGLRSAQTYFNALQTCTSIQPAGYSRANLCNYHLWYSGCKNKLFTGSTQNEMLSDIYTDPSMVPNTALVEVHRASNCNNSWVEDVSESKPMPFRCCL